MATEMVIAFSPRTWRCFLISQGEDIDFIVFSTHVESLYTYDTKYDYNSLAIITFAVIVLVLNRLAC